MAKDSDEPWRYRGAASVAGHGDIALQGSKLTGWGARQGETAASRLPIVIISGHGNVETAFAAIKRGAYESTRKKKKPFQPTGCADQRPRPEASTLKAGTANAQRSAYGTADRTVSIITTSPTIDKVATTKVA